MSIRARLVVLVLFVTVAPALLIGAYFYELRSGDIDDARRELTSLTQFLAVNLDSEIGSASQLIELLAEGGTLGTLDPEACSAKLARIVEAHPRYTGAFVVPLGGPVRCASDPRVVGAQYSERDYVRAALATSRPVIGDGRIGERTGAPVLPIAYAVRDMYGNARFVLVASLGLARFSRMIQEVGPFRDIAVIIFNDTGTIVSGHPNAEALAGTSIRDTTLADLHNGSGAARTAVLADVDGTRRIWSVRPAQRNDASNLSFAIGVKEQEIVGAANADLVRTLTVFAALAFVLFAGVLLILRRYLQGPIDRIAGFVGELGGGNSAARIDGPLPAGELGELMRKLNNTAVAMEQHQRELDAAREHLHQANKVEAIGQLTGGIAHDLNNILTVIIGNIDVIARAVADDRDLALSATLVRRAADRGADLTRSLVAYVRKQPLKPRPIDVNELVRETDEMLRRTLGEHIDIRTVAGEGIDPAMLDPTYLQNALINLAINARDAMPGGGKLTIETANVYLDADYASRHVEVSAGHYVMLAVTDTGSGMPADIIDRVFEPFFTTKARSKGSGLGLTMVYGFIKQSNGHIKVYSEVGAGTTVKMYLPRAGSAAVASPPAGEENAMPRGDENILVVEDDPMVRQSVLAQLADLGYRTVPAGTGREALEILAGRDDIDLLFTDVVLPGGTNGRDLADEAARIRPGLKVLYTSGYTENAIIHQGRVDRDIVLLTKPYAKSDLARNLRIALAAPARAAVGKTEEVSR